MWCMEGGVDTTFVAQVLNVDVGDDELGTEAEALRGSEGVSVFVDEGIATIYEVLGGFAKAAGGIDVAAEAAG